MARTGYFGGLVAAALMTLCVSSPSYAATATDQTFATSDWPCACVVIGLDYSAPASFVLPAFLPAAINEHRVSARHPVDFRGMAIHERASRAAVRPSAVAGWGSGRARRLASG